MHKFNLHFSAKQKFNKALQNCFKTDISRAEIESELAALLQNAQQPSRHFLKHLQKNASLS